MNWSTKPFFCRKSFSIFFGITLLVLTANRGYLLCLGDILFVFDEWTVSILVIPGTASMFSDDWLRESSLGVTNWELGSVWRCYFVFQTISLTPMKFYLFFTLITGEFTAFFNIFDMLSLFRKRGLSGLALFLFLSMQISLGDSGHLPDSASLC